MTRAGLPPDGYRRVFLFAAKGKYEQLGSQPRTGGQEAALPKTYEFEQNYPNPFNPVTTFSFALPEAGRVTLEVYNILGRKVATLVDQEYPAGRHQVQWTSSSDGGEEIASGVYFAKIIAGDYTATKKMVVVK